MAYQSSQARGEIGAAAVVYATATVTPDLSHICDVHYGLSQCRILNPLSEDRDQTRILTETNIGISESK